MEMAMEADQTQNQEPQRQLLSLLHLVLGWAGNVIRMRLLEETRGPYLDEPSQKKNRKAAVRERGERERSQAAIASQRFGSKHQDGDDHHLYSIVSNLFTLLL